MQINPQKGEKFLPQNCFQEPDVSNSYFYLLLSFDFSVAVIHNINGRAMLINCMVGILFLTFQTALNQRDVVIDWYWKVWLLKYRDIKFPCDSGPDDVVRKESPLTTNNHIYRWVATRSWSCSNTKELRGEMLTSCYLNVFVWRSFR